MIYLLLYYLLNEIEAATKNGRQLRNQIKQTVFYSLL